MADLQNASQTNRVHLEAVQSITPGKVAQPGLARRISVSSEASPATFQGRFRITLYYRKRYEHESGWVVAGLVKDSFTRALAQEPLLAGRLRRRLGEENEWEISYNDSGMRLVEARVDTSLTDFLSSKDVDDAESNLGFWMDISSETPQYSALFYLQVTNFNCGGYAVSFTCSLLLADPVLLGSFLRNWSRIHTNILSNCELNHTPLFYFPIFKRNGHSAIPNQVFTMPSPTRCHHHKTRMLKFLGRDTKELIQSPKETVSMCLEVGTKNKTASNFFLIIGNPNGDLVFESGNFQNLFAHGENKLSGEITQSCWDDLRAGDLCFYKDNKPEKVSYEIQPGSNEGLVLIMPPVDEDNVGVLITVTVPE